MILHTTYVSTRPVFWAETKWLESRDSLMRADFWRHRKPCQVPQCDACAAGLDGAWWTPYPERAARLIQFADIQTSATLENVSRTLAMSEATAPTPGFAALAPPGLSYFPFQLAGIQYLLEHNATLVGDEMGTGKTIQVLGLINADPTISRAIIVCPATLRLNWLREAAKWLCRPFHYHVLCDGKPRDLPTFLASGSTVTTGKALPESVDPSFILIANYERLREYNERLTEENEWINISPFPKLMELDWDLLVADEAHRCRGRGTQQTRAVLGQQSYHDLVDNEMAPGLVHRARRKVFLTGTPIPNRPIELHPLLEALNPDAWPFRWYTTRYCAAVWRGRGWDFSGACNLDDLRLKLRSSLLLRRLKGDVLKDLPPKTRQIVVLPCNGALKAVEKEYKAFEKHEAVIAGAEATLAGLGENDETYAEAAAKLEEAISLAFHELSAERHRVALAKVPAVIEHADMALENGQPKLAIWAHHRDVIETFAKHYGTSAVVIAGDTPMAQRQQIVDRFQTDPKLKVFIGSITAAGVGITLTAASLAVFAELDWVPGNVVQCEDRHHRIGQHWPVLVQHLVFDGSVDARMIHRLVAKARIADKALDGRG